MHKSPYHDVLQRGHEGKRLCGLKGANQALLAYLMGFQALNFLSFEHYSSSIRFQEARNKIKNGGLSRPVRTNKAQDFSLVNQEIAVIDGSQPTKILG
jgi:hypothetical protein